MISFQNPGVLLLLLLIPIGGLFLRWRQKYYLQRLQLMGKGSIANSPWSWTRQSIWLLICTLLIVALARPVWGTALEAVDTQGVSVMFVLDVSKSMDAEDASPSRLERAKLSLTELFKQLSGNELGLILFAGYPIVQFPLTTDTLSATALVKQVTTDSISAQGTNIADAILVAVKSLTSASKGKHLIVLLTDGEGHEGDVNSTVAEAVRDGITIYTIGYGDSAGVPIPVHNPDGSVSDKRDQAGNPVKSALDEKTLTEIAIATGGLYEHVLPNGDEVHKLMKAINQYTPNTLNRGVQVTGIERFNIFIALAVILLTLNIILPRLQKLTKICLFLFILACSCGCSVNPAERNDAGNTLYSQAQYDSAIDAYQAAQVASPDRPEAYYNAASAYSQNGEFDKAIDALHQALKTTDAGLRTQAYYNLGNVYFQMDRFDDAVDA
nr:VWA domain-containing protein [Anaerolineae bacterium]